MKEKILFAIAFIFHPIFLPIIYYLLLEPSIDVKELSFVVLLGLVVPVGIFKFLKMELSSPGYKQRRIIYIILALLYYFLGYYLKDFPNDDVAIKLFYPFAIGLILLTFAVRRMNISWHALGWGIAVFLSFGVGIVRFEGLNNFSIAWTMAIITLVLGIIVMLIRYLQSAHTISELITGYMLGIIIPYLTYFAVHNGI